MTRCTCDLCRGFRLNGGGYHYITHAEMLYVRVMNEDYDPNNSPHSILDRWISLERGYGGPECMGQEYALMTHKNTACVVNGEDIHPSHNPLSNANATSPKLSKSQKSN